MRRSINFKKTRKRQKICLMISKIKGLRGLMGGFGSGLQCGSDRKTLAEECMCIDIRILKRNGLLEPMSSGSWRWQNGCYIDIRTTFGAVELFYKTSYNEQPLESVYIKARLSWTRCNYGGWRPWFKCPAEGCGRRVAKLYIVRKYFLCRHCCDLAYLSQRESRECRLLDRAQGIYHRLGANSRDDLWSVPKPKRMHRTTYDRLIRRAEELELDSLRAYGIRYRLI